MKKIILTSLTLLALNTVHADYLVKIPFEQGQGGGLPSGSINFVTPTPPAPIENWQPVASIISAWADNGGVYGCVGTPSETTVLKDDEFTQNFSGCKQNQTRTVQKREQETTTLIYRNVDAPITETKTNGVANYVKTSLGTASCLYSYPRTYWLAGINDSQLATVNGVVLPIAYGVGVTSIYYGGKTYKKGTTVEGTTNGRPLYAICK